MKINRLNSSRQARGKCSVLKQKPVGLKSLFMEKLKKVVQCDVIKNLHNFCLEEHYEICSLNYTSKT